MDKDGKPEGKNHPPAAAIILGLVSEGKEREELVIPETLGGYPVKQIGDYQQKGIMGGSKYFYGIGAKNIKKIVLNHDCYLFDCGIKQFDGDIIVNANVYVLSSGYRNYESSEKLMEIYCGKQYSNKC